jgi:hypothetical protein
MPGFPIRAAIIAVVSMTGDAEREGKGREYFSHVYRLVSVQVVPFDSWHETPGIQRE